MGAFTKNDITSNGLLALGRAMTGESLRFTKIVIGSGYMPEGKTPRAMEAVVTPEATLSITRLQVGTEPGTAIVGTVFTNKEVTKDFAYRELAVYAETETTGEVLYCYGNAGDAAELIPAGGGANIVEKQVDVVTVVSGAANVTAYINLDAYATVRQAQEAISTANEAMDKAAAAQTSAAAAKAQSAKAEEDVATFGATVADSNNKIDTVWNALFTDITTNPFTVGFANLDGITLIDGVWNSALQRLEC